MLEPIQIKLDASRKELLDLGLRNPLLNYKTPKGKGLKVVQEKSSFIFDILVRQNKAMTFLGIPEKKKSKNAQEIPEGDEDIPALGQPTEEAYQDTKLQTAETEQKLQTRLLNTYYFARTSIEEQGVNILYLSLGMLRWFDSEDREMPRYAPLILIPVELERSSAQERFRLKYSGSDIGANLSLQAKMNADFNLTIPDLPEMEDIDVPSYYNQIRDHIAKQEGWSVEDDEMELGFFSFGKFMIYNDLDSTKWPEVYRPALNQNIISLFETGFQTSYRPEEEDHKDLDAETNANALFRVVDADSSQLQAMLAVNEGHNLVIQGPPGTGKSQTITNIIANSIGQGKKVLFVAEKMAALEVVKRRLDAIQLGEACLELHSHKANKRDLLEELKRVMELGKPAVGQLAEEVQQLSSSREELNRYCHAVNAFIGESGLTAHQVIGFLLEMDTAIGQQSLINIPIPNIGQWTAHQVREATAFAERIEARLRDIGVPQQLLFWGSELKVLLPHEKGAVQQQIQQAAQSLKELRELAERVQVATGLPLADGRESLQELIAQLDLASQAPELNGVNIDSEVWLLRREDIRELMAKAQSLSLLYRKYKDTLIPEGWSADILDIRQNLVAHGHKWYKFLIGSYRRANQRLASLLKTALPEDVSERLQIIDAISEARHAESELTALEPLGASLFGRHWSKQNAASEQLSRIADYLARVHQHYANHKVSLQLLDLLKKDGAAGSAAAFVTQLKQQAIAIVSQRDTAFQALQWNEAKGITRSEVEPMTFRAQEAFWLKRAERLTELQLVIDWNNLAAAAEQNGFSYLIDVARHWAAAAQWLKVSLLKTWYEYLIGQAFRQHPELTQFERVSHENTVERFKRLDQLNFVYNRARVALKHWESIPKSHAGGQVNVLRTEFNKRARHMAIRKLVEEAGAAMQAIKPVWMMSPMSIANFLPPGSIDFDLVIFDEASQVRPVDALGAIMRGQQLVVVGDTKQLPPTSFFDKLNTDVEDEDNQTADMQSILGMCDGQGAPSHMLRWHYRSRHESLISLSNHEFYENKLVIFPSPGSRQSLGLKFHHLPDALYDRGKTRTNPMEAERVAQAVIAHAKQSPELSLGVVAFSTSQMQAIQAALESQRRQHPEGEAFFKSHPHEPFFIKNLENVQGDERDVIYISIGYGRIDNGTVPMSFGPLNNEGGERRLNVLITRAKMRCEVFTNITAADLKVAENAKFGIRALKSFLYFAQFAKFEQSADPIITDIRPFEEEVARRLTAAGYTVRNKVGSAGFYLDLAIVDAENPGRYILGIECDGQNYAKARSATDRDRLRKQVLEMFGWNAYRVWATDWYRNPEREFGRIVEAIEHAKVIVANSDQEVKVYEEEQRLLEREIIQPVAQSINYYRQAVLPAILGSQEMHLHSFGNLASWISDVVKVEGPVHFDEVARRMVDAAGVSKVGSRIKYTLTQACRYGEQTGLMKLKGDFLWNNGMDVPIIRDRSQLPPASRRLQYIAPEEVQLAIVQVVTDAIAVSEDSAVNLASKLFGFSRVTEEMKQMLLEAIAKAVQEGMVKSDQGFLKTAR
jgi:very-short-patch-repair endonuclease